MIHAWFMPACKIASGLAILYLLWRRNQILRNRK